MNLPTKITVARIALIPLFVAFCLIDFPYHFLAAVIVYAVASLTDWLDGHLARKYNMVTDLGKFLDPVADKVLVATALVIIAALPSIFQLYLIIFSIVIIARELIITCFRTIAASKNLILAADYLGKIKTCTQLAGIILYLLSLSFDGNAQVIFMWIGFILLAIATLFTIISATNYIVKNRVVLSATKDNDMSNER